jgi:hypothetical protein
MLNLQVKEYEMEINNNSEINKMFKTEDNPIQPPPELELQTSPLGDNSVPGESIFQTDYNDNPPPEFSGRDEDGDSDSDNFDTIIGDHKGFGFNHKKLSSGISFVLLPIMLIIGFATGVFICHIYFFGIELSAEQKAARTAIKEVKEYVHKNMGEDMNVIFTRSFVNNKVNEYECVIVTAIESDVIKYNIVNYRVIIVKGDDNIKIFPEMDYDEFDRLNKSNDPDDLINASAMLLHHMEFEKALEQIWMGDSGWVDIDPVLIDIKLTKAKFF